MVQECSLRWLIFNAVSTLIHLPYQVLSAEYSPQPALMFKVLPHQLQKWEHFIIEPLKAPVSLVPMFLHVTLSGNSARYCQ